MRTIGVVTVARSDYGIYLPVLQRIQGDPDLRLHLIVAGMHLSPEFGLTVQAIEQDGFEISERIEMLLSSDTPEGIAKSMGLGTIGFAQAYARLRPDILLVLGDRFEMHAAAMAALPFKIPIAHIHGGEVTIGAIDNSIRHALTKMSHLHFVATEVYAKRVMQMGEEPWRVIVSGGPSLDNLHSVKLLSKAELEWLDFDLTKAFLLVTYHPVTLEYEQTDWQIQQLLAALDVTEMPIVITYPNADTGYHTIVHRIEAFATEREHVRIVRNLGMRRYFSLMRFAAAMVGNSSSGIIEAPSFELPVVNIGTRQEGRVKARNVIDVGYEEKAILAGIEKALSAPFRRSLKGMVNPYGDGHAAEVIVETLKRIELDNKLITKRFVDHFTEAIS